MRSNAESALWQRLEVQLARYNQQNQQQQQQQQQPLPSQPRQNEQQEAPPPVPSVVISATSIPTLRPIGHNPSMTETCLWQRIEAQIALSQRSESMLDSFSIIGSSKKNIRHRAASPSKPQTCETEWRRQETRMKEHESSLSSGIYEPSDHFPYSIRPPYNNIDKMSDGALQSTSICNDNPILSSTQRERRLYTHIDSDIISDAPESKRNLRTLFEGNSIKHNPRDLTEVVSYEEQMSMLAGSQKTIPEDRLSDNKEGYSRERNEGGMEEEETEDEETEDEETATEVIDVSENEPSKAFSSLGDTIETIGNRGRIAAQKYIEQHRESMEARTKWPLPEAICVVVLLALMACFIAFLSEKETARICFILLISCAVVSVVGRIIGLSDPTSPAEPIDLFVKFGFATKRPRKKKATIYASAAPIRLRPLRDALTAAGMAIMIILFAGAVALSQDYTSGGSSSKMAMPTMLFPAPVPNTSTPALQPTLSSIPQSRTFLPSAEWSFNPPTDLPTAEPSALPSAAPSQLPSLSPTSP